MHNESDTNIFLTKKCDSSAAESAALLKIMKTIAHVAQCHLAMFRRCNVTVAFDNPIGLSFDFFFFLSFKLN